MAIPVNRKIGIPQVRFNPTFYKTAYKQYRQGVYAEVIEMFNRAEADSHVTGCLLGRKAGFQQHFTVTSYDDNSKSIERADFIKSIIMNLDYRQLFKDIFEAKLKKFSVIDFEWEVVQGKQVPIEHELLEHKYFRYDPKDGILKINAGKQLIEIPPGEGLVCEARGMPAMLPVLRDFILKEFGLESWAGFIEVFGEGIIIGKYPPGSDPDFVQAVEDAVTAIARSSRGTLPDGAEIEIKETQRSTGDHNMFVENSNRGISITLLGHANAVEQSKGLQVGENLTQYKVKREIAVDDMFFIDNQMQKLVRMIWDRNFGDGKYPVFALDKKEQPDVKERLEVLDLAYNHGVGINADEYRKLDLDVEDVGYIRKQSTLDI